MVIYVEPKVHLVTRPQITTGLLEFTEDQLGMFPGEALISYPGIDGEMNHGIAIAETAARLCYMSFKGGRTDIKKFLNNLISSKHGSVFEHINYGFIITGISRSLSLEFVRHRHFSYSQLSQRYVDESDVAFVEPPDMWLVEGDAGKAMRDSFDASNNEALTTYRDLVLRLSALEPFRSIENNTDRRKAVRQAARSVLPNCTETKMFVTGNVRAWRHFLEMRGSALADSEIRRLAIMVWKVLAEETPMLFADVEGSFLDTSGKEHWFTYEQSKAHPTYEILSLRSEYTKI